MRFRDCFEIDEDARKNFLERYIVKKLPDDMREEGKQRAKEIVNLYGGVDKDALAILMYATNRDRFDEFAGKLMAFYRDTLQHVPAQQRKKKTADKMERVDTFLKKCYTDLGVGLEEKVSFLKKL